MTDSNTIYDAHSGQHLVYVLYRGSGIPHYVGATSNPKRPYKKGHPARKDHDVTSVEIVQECLSLEDAGKLEDQLINQYGKSADGGTLVNVKGGGHGLKTDETKAKMSTALKGRAHTDEAKAKMSAAKKGRKHKPFSEETKANISAALKGRVFSAEHKAKLSAAAKGRTLSDEHRAKLSAATKARWAK